MATKTISIMEEVYDQLIKLKKENESFSKEIMRLIDKKGKLSECAGLWSWMSEDQISSIEENIKKRREISKKAKKEKDYDWG